MVHRTLCLIRTSTKQFDDTPLVAKGIELILALVTLFKLKNTRFFGISILLDRHPIVSREEVHNFVRTLPMYRIFRGMAEQESQMEQFLEDYSHKLGASSKQEITSRDLAFAREGLNMAARRMGDRIIEPVKEAFVRAYMD